MQFKFAAIRVAAYSFPFFFLFHLNVCVGLVVQVHYSVTYSYKELAALCGVRIHTEIKWTLQIISSRVVSIQVLVYVAK